MSSLPESLIETAKKYSKLNDTDKKAFIEEAYHAHSLSFPNIAELVGTYGNKLRRDAIRLGVAIRSKADAQSLALSSGRHQHPTKGTKRGDDVKIKISDGMAKNWENLDDDERKKRSDIGKELWDKMTPQEKEDFQRKAGNAVRQASKDGSKLERHIYTALLEAGWRVDFHKEHMIVNERLQLDMMLPELNIAIEIDGPSHFSPIWGKTTFERNQRADQQKNGLLLGRGMVVIRVLNNKQPSQKTKRDITNKLIALIKDLEKNWPSIENRYIEIGE